MPAKNPLNKSKNAFFDEWLNNPIKATFMAVATIISFLAIGFSIGVAKTESDNKLDQLKMKVEYDSEIQKIKDDCREERLTQYEKAVSDLSNFVIQQKDSHHEK